MANIAQPVNVPQSMILTDRAKMIFTPTCHVFEIYAVHHDATFIPTELTCPDYTVGGQTIPSLSASASKTSKGRVLTAEAVNAHNTIDHPDEVQPRPFSNVTSTRAGFTARLPARSVVVLRVE